MLTALSDDAYRTDDRRPSFRTSTVGFGVLAIVGVVEPRYQWRLEGDYHPSGRDLLAPQPIEGALVALGLGRLLYAVYVHGSGPRRENLERSPDTR